LHLCRVSGIIAGMGKGGVVLKKMCYSRSERKSVVFQLKMIQKGTLLCVGIFILICFSEIQVFLLLSQPVAGRLCHKSGLLQFNEILLENVDVLG